MSGAPLPRNVRAHLARFALFDGLPPDVLEAVIGALKYRTLQPGDVLLQAGDPPDGLFLVLDGRLEALRALGEPADAPAGPIGRGEVIGEMGLLTGEVRSRTVVAVRPSSVVWFPAERFWGLLGQRPEKLLHLTQAVVRRAQGRRDRTRLRSVAVVSLERREPHLDFARALAEALRAIAPARLVTADQVEARFGGDGERDASMPLQDRQPVLDWLAELEAEHDFLVYHAEAWPTVWTRRCLAQADLVLWVARAEADRGLTVTEKELLGPSVATPSELVLLQRGPASDTAAWLAPRQVRRHHHVAGPKDLGRLARLLAGQSLDLVLGGGGARSFAHLGVLRAFEEAGLEVDHVGGTSGGAAMAALCAQGLPATEMQARVRRHMTKRSSTVELTLPWLALCTGRKGTRVLRALCGGDHRIEDLPRGFFAVSMDLFAAEVFVHRDGPLFEALRASTAVPGVWPPVMSPERCLVDGGILDNLPIDVMQRESSGLIVAVDVARERTIRYPRLHPPVVSGWRLLLQRLNPFRRWDGHPNIGDVLMRTVEVGAIVNERAMLSRTPPFAHLTPPVGQFGMFDVEAFDALVDAGYRYTVERLPALLDALARTRTGT